MGDRFWVRNIGRGSGDSSTNTKEREQNKKWRVRGDGVRPESAVTSPGNGRVC
jgi:hypothetical protein